LQLYDDTTDIGRARAFGGTLLVLGTFQMATSLKTIKAGNTLNPSLRAMLSNYGVVIAIFVFSILNYVFKDLKMATLDVPTEFAPTYIEPDTLKARSWIVNPMGSTEQPMQGWAIGFTALPALGLTLLGYMDQNVSTLIVNRKDHMLKKGPVHTLIHTHKHCISNKCRERQRKTRRCVCDMTYPFLYTHTWSYSISPTMSPILFGIVSFCFPRKNWWR